MVSVRSMSTVVSSHSMVLSYSIRRLISLSVTDIKVFDSKISVSLTLTVMLSLWVFVESIKWSYEMANGKFLLGLSLMTALLFLFFMMDTKPYSTGISYLHFDDDSDDPDESHTNPISTVHLSLHPSPLMRLPSSQLK